MELGSNQIRPLFASTGVKQEGLPKDYYLRNLYLPEAVLTLPVDVLEVAEGEELEEAFPFQTKHIDAFFSFLTPAGINLSQIYDQLFKEGAEAFQKSFAEMLKGLK
jgi:transaldolase